MGKSTLPLNSFFGPYYLSRLIAIGGMAEIYLVTAKGIGGFEKQLALKVIHPDFADDERFVQMLVDEAKIAVKLNHPNVAQTFDLGKIDNNYFISMEYVDGADFFQLLKRTAELGHEFPVEASLLIAQEALCGLDYAHKKSDDDGTPLKIIHRDISPQNILLSRHGEVKIVDFGIAKAANLSTKTRSGVIKGKLVYMSPEQSWGDQIDHRSDIFSAGIVLYEALTGGSLYREKNPVKLLEMVRRAEIPPPSTRRPSAIPPELDQLVMRALSPKADGRYNTAGEFADQLAQFLRRYSPDFTSQDLGRMVLNVKGGLPPDGGMAASPAPPPSLAMHREDFEVPQQSVIFAADAMAEGARPGTRRSGQVKPTLMAPPQARLLLQTDNGETPYPLSDNFIIGRAGDLRLGDARVSRRHARIQVEGAAYVLSDMSSSNGTYVNDHKLATSYQLRQGDVVRVGPFHMRFDFQLDGPSNATEPPMEAAATPGSQAHHPIMPGDAQEQTAGSEDVLDGESLDAVRRSAASQPSAAELHLTLGADRVSLPVADGLPLASSLLTDDTTHHGAAAQLSQRPDGTYIEPATGRTGVTVNGAPLTAPQRLQDGDTITVGPLELTFSS